MNARTPLARRSAGVLGVTLTAVLALSGCGTGGTSDADDSGDAASPVTGGTLTFAVSSDSACVDPQQVGSNDTIYSVRQLVDSLTDQDPKTGEIVPWLAKSWEVNADSTAFTFTLAGGATFSDGTPVDAQVVADNFAKLPTLGPRASLGTGYLAGYKGTTVTDPTTFTVTFDRPNAQFLQATSTHSLGLVSESTLAKTPDERCTSAIGSGPFVLDSYTPNSAITLTRREGYDWGSSLWKHDGEAYLDELDFKIVPESGVRAGSLASGQVDAIGNITPEDEGTITSGGAELQARANPGVAFNLGINNSRPLGADPAVRKAISQAINRQEVVDTVFTSQSKPATSILAATTPGYASQEKALAFDAGAAEDTLTGGGWAKGSDGVWAKGGQRLSLVVDYFTNSASNQPALELIQQQLKKAGIEIVLEQHPISDIVALQQSGDFDVLWGNVTRADPDILRSSYLSTGANLYKLPASELDALLVQQAGESDADARADLVAQAQELIVENAYVVPVVELTTVLGVSSAVHDLTFDASSRISLFDAWKNE